MSKSLANCHVVVTGGTGALGRAVVGALLDEGAICHIPNLVPEELDGFAFAANANVHLVKGVDLTDETGVRQFYSGLPGLWGSVHLAGGFAMGNIADTAASGFQEQMNMNALSCFLCCREAVRAIRSRPGSQAPAQAGGRIVNVAARPALEPRLGAGMTAYTMSKAAVAALTQSLAQELSPESIWVNAVAPSVLDTPSNRAAMPGADHAKWPTVAHVAELITFLASPANQATRGAVIPVYGGV